MNENEMIEFEGRQYVNPDISRDEQMAFIDTMRDMQAQNNAQIATETHNLGTDVEPIRGGLSGSEEYWKGLYQTPQTEALVANMKAVAQQTALNNALSNYQSALQNRYNQVYRDYQRRAYNYNMSKDNPANGTTEGGLEYEDYDGEEEVSAGEKKTVTPSSTQSGFNQSAGRQSALVSGGGIPYSTTGQGFIVEDKNGNRTGVRIYYDTNGDISGAETKMSSYNSRQAVADKFGKMISDGGKVYTSANKEIGTGLGWASALGESLF